MNELNLQTGLSSELNLGGLHAWTDHMRLHREAIAPMLEDILKKGKENNNGNTTDSKPASLPESH